MKNKITKKQFEFILQNGEGLNIEFKENFDSKGLAKEIVAFANAKGGKIFLGVNDMGVINVIKITNKLKSQIQDIARNCDPSIKLNLIELNNVLINDVFEGENKPYKCSQGFFIRQSANSQKMQRNEIIEFINQEGKIKFDNILTKIKNYDNKLVEEYLIKSGIKQKADKNTLFNLGLLIKMDF